MTVVAIILSTILAMSQSAKTDAKLQHEIETFVENLRSARMAAAYAQMSVEAQHAFGRAQFDAYVASRRRALGPVVGVANVRVSAHVDPEEGMTVYDAEVRFEKASAPAGFVMGKEGGAWRIHRLVIGMPDGVEAVSDADEVLPIAKDLLAVAKKEGVASLAARFSEKELARAEQTPETVLATFQMIDGILGRLRGVTLGEAEEEDPECTRIEGDGTFEHGKAPVQLVLCWHDGEWRLRHASITPLLEPSLLERSIAYTFHGKVSAECPRNVDFPVGASIVCRVTEHGRPPRDATILRTTVSGWKVVALETAK